MGIIIRQSIKGTIVTYFGTFIGFITTFFVLTRYLTAEEIGLTRVLVDAATLFIGLAQLGTNSSIVRFFPYFKNDSEKDHGFFFWTLVVPFVGFTFVGILYWILHVPIANLFIEKSPLFVDYYYFVLPLAFFMLYQTIFETNSNVLMRIVVPRFVREVAVRILTLGAYLLYAFRYVSLDGFVIALCLVYAVASLFNIVYLFSIKRISLRPDTKFITKSLARNYLFYTLFLVASALTTIFGPSLSSFFITAKMGLSFTGIFAIANYITVMVAIPYRSLGAIAQPNISQSIRDNDRDSTNKLCKQVSLNQLFIGAIVFCAIWINIDIIFELLPNGNIYAAARQTVFYLGISQLLMSSLCITTSVLSYSKYYYYSLVFTLVFTLAALLFNNAFIPLWGMNGAALATLLSNIIYYLLSLLLVWWKLKISPFSKAQLKVLVIVGVMLLGNFLWGYFVAPRIGSHLFCSDLTQHLIDACLRTLLLLPASIFVAYRWQVSAEINGLIKQFFRLKN